MWMTDTTEDVSKCLRVSATMMLGVLMFVGSIRSANAQASAPPTMHANNAPLTTRTGQHVPHTFASYTTPKQCDQVKLWSESIYWRARRPDTTYYPRTGRRYQQVTIDSVRACISRFSIATTAPTELLGLGQAYLTAASPIQADSAFQALLRAVAKDSVRGRAWVLYQIVKAYLDAAPPQLTDAERYLTQLDALGSRAAAERMLAHRTLADRAQVRDSVSLWERELNASRTAMHELQGDLQREYAPASAEVYRATAELRARQGNAPAALAILDTARRELVPLRPSVEEILGNRRFENLGKPQPSVDATHWFNVGSTGSVRPTPGKVNYLMEVSLISPQGYYEAFGVVRRLMAKYGARGLDVTLMIRTEGYFRRRLVPADTEVANIRHYYLDFLKLPITLAVWKTDLGKRDDGRVEPRVFPNTWFVGDVIVDRKGIARLTTLTDRDHEAVIEDVIESLL